MGSRQPAKWRFSLRILSVILVSTAVALGAIVERAGAQEASPLPTLSDEQVNKIVQMALDNIHYSRCEAETLCEPVRPEERASPPITIVEARAIMNRGILSGAAQLCGLDWQRQNFGPMMAYWRNTAKKNERQMALIGLLHGIMQALAGPRPGTTPPPCTGEHRRDLVALLRFVP
jgi:hypothetical protein